MMHEPAKLTLLAAALLLTAGGAAAQVKTGEVRVTASRVEQELLDVPMSVTVMTSEDIEKSSAKTVGDLLQDVPGVEITNDGSQGLKRIKIRGEDSFRTLVLIDGQKISEQKSMSGAAILIDPAMIERVEVIKGPASVLYGSEAVGGVVNIITKKGGYKPLSGEASVGWNGAGHGWKESIGLFGGADGFKYRLNAGYEHHKDLKTPKGYQPHTMFRQGSASAFLSYDLTEKVTVGLSADTFKSRIMSGSMTYAPEDFFVDIPKWNRDKVNLFAEGRNLTPYLNKLRWDGYWQKTHKEMHNHVSTTEGASVTMDNFADNRITTLGASVQADWQLGAKNLLVTGLEYSHDKLKADTDVYMDLAVKTGPVSMKSDYVTRRYNEGSQATTAVFAQMDTDLPYDFSINYGVRYTYVSTKMDQAYAAKTGVMNMTNPFTGTITTNYNGEDDGSAGVTGRGHNDRFVFNFGLAWKGLEDTTFRAGWSQGFRAPILQEKYLQTSVGSTSQVTFGNPNLKPETSNNFEIGARYDGSVLSADLSVFYSDAKNYIDTIPVSTYSDDYMYENISKAKTWGIEGDFKLTVAEHFKPYATLTFLKRKFEMDGWSTWDTGNAAFTARYGLKTEFPALKGTFNTDLYARSSTSRTFKDKEGKNDYRYGGFTTLNFGAGYEFKSSGDQKYRLDAELLNITNKLYQYNASVYEPGRHFNVKFTASF